MLAISRFYSNLGGIFRFVPVAAPMAAAALPTILLVMAAGCTERRGSEGTPLIRAGEQVVTVEDFHRAYGLMMAGMREVEPGDDPESLDAKVRLLQEMAHEASLLEKARVDGIRLEDGELEAAVQAIRKDYPDDSFEEMLVENAIRFNDWQREMEKRLIIEKLLDAEVYDRIRITESELAEVHRTRLGGPSDESAGEPENRLVERLKRRKAEALLDGLVEAATGQYPPVIDPEAARKLLDGDAPGDGG